MPDETMSEVRERTLREGAKRIEMRAALTSLQQATLVACAQRVLAEVVSYNPESEYGSDIADAILALRNADIIN